jgi:hypothetical protein
MSLDEDILIERFLKNELSKIEKDNVSKRMNSDAQFRAKVLLEQQLFDTLNQNSWSFVKNIDTLELKEYEKLFKEKKIKEIEKTISKANENFKKKKIFKSRKWYVLSSAALVALLISVYLLKPQSLNTNEIYTDYINRIELPSTINRSNSNDLEKLSYAKKLFTNKEYSSAIDIFSKALKHDSKNSNIYIYLAISQIEINDFKNAETTLDSLLESNLIDAEKSYWFKSLLYVKSNQIDKAKVLLSLIISNSYFQSENAKTLLNKLNKL